MRLETIIERARALGLPLAKDEFRETKETPLPELPYLVYITPQDNVSKSDDGAVGVKAIQAAIELYTDKTADSSLEKEVEQKVLYDVGFNKFQETIQSEDMVQTAYEFTIYEKIRKRGKRGARSDTANPKGLFNR